MIGFLYPGFGTDDLAVLAILLGFLALLLYRVFRKDPTSKVVRLGLFIERQRVGEDGEQITERKEWPG